MADVRLSDENTIKVNLASEEPIKAKITDVNYIPGYAVAEEQRRLNELERMANEEEREAYYEDIQQRVANGEFNGKDGEQGLPGEKGEKGDKGDPGEKGKDGTMSFEELTEEQKASLKGDPGEKGEPGETGDSGVYIGNEEPTNGAKVWIDLDEPTVEFATKEYVNEMLGVIENGSY